MEIVEAQDVREVLFDAETGRPIRTSGRRHGGPRGRRPTHASAASPTGDAASSRRGRRRADKLLDEFPIDFDARSNNRSDRQATRVRPETDCDVGAAELTDNYDPT